MSSQKNKKRKIRLGDNVYNVYSKRIKVGDYYPEYEFAKATINGVYFIFEVSSGYVLSQGNKYTDALNGSKKFLEKSDGNLSLLIEHFKFKK